jgi:hypothetical protein
MLHFLRPIDDRLIYSMSNRLLISGKPSVDVTDLLSEHLLLFHPALMRSLR